MSEQAGPLEHDLSDGRRVCDWCLGPTARLTPSGPRHGWCEPYNRRPPVWQRRLDTAASRVTPAVPEQGSQAPAKTWARPRRKPAEKKPSRRRKAA